MISEMNSGPNGNDNRSTQMPSTQPEKTNQIQAVITKSIGVMRTPMMWSPMTQNTPGTPPYQIVSTAGNKPDVGQTVRLTMNTYWKDIGVPDIRS